MSESPVYRVNPESDPAGRRPVTLAGSNLGERAHICGFFRSSEEAYQLLLPFIKEGLELGHKAVHTVDPARREEHSNWLASSTGVDIPNDKLEVRDWNNSHFCGGNFEQDRTLALWGKVIQDAKQAGFPLVRFITEMEWALKANMDLNDLLEYEAKANYVWLSQDKPYNPAICVYDLKRFRGDVIVDIMRTHPLVIIGGILQENPFFVPPDEFLAQLGEKRSLPLRAEI